MAEESVETVRSIYKSWAAGDFREPMRFMDPHVVFVLHRGFPDGGAYLGREQLVEYTRAFLEPWERLTIEADEIAGAGGSVVAAVRQRGIGRQSGAVTELRYFHVWTLQGDRVVRIDGFRDRQEAFDAAGISP